MELPDLNDMDDIILDIEEGLEGSYPSSHAMLGMCVFITAAMQFKNRLKNKNVNLTVRIICVALAILTVVSRLLSGVHWFTDIIGGVLVSAFLISFRYLPNFGPTVFS